MKHGDFLWCDAMTSDPQAAADFYSAVVGWGLLTPEVTGMDYTILTVEGQGVAGIMPIPDDQKGHPPAWTMHVAVDDVDSAAAKLKSLGGTVHRGPWEVPGQAVRKLRGREPARVQQCAASLIPLASVAPRRMHSLRGAC